MAMKRRVKGILRLLYDQPGNVVKAVRGLPLNTPPLVSSTLDEEEVEIARRLIREKGGWYDPDLVGEYEAAFAGWNGSRHAYAFMGGRVALSACINVLGLKPGDEVLLPGYTCVVVPNAFHFDGIRTVYCDIELDTYGLDASLLEEKITPRTKAVLIQHLYGLVNRDLEKILEIAKEHGLYVIEDCAQSTGATFKERKVGNYGDVAFYSSEHSKVFTTVQGGFAVTNDDGLAEKIEAFKQAAAYPEEERVNKLLYNVLIDYHTLKDPARWWKKDIVNIMYASKLLISTTQEEIAGKRPVHYGSKMPAALAEIGMSQLEKIDVYNQGRRDAAREWDRWCDEAGYDKPLVTEGSQPVYLRYPVMVEPEKKEDTSWAYRELGVSLGVWFKSNIHPSDFPVQGCPRADQAVRQCVNFPTYKDVT